MSALPIFDPAHDLEGGGVGAGGLDARNLDTDGLHGGGFDAGGPEAGVPTPVDATQVPDANVPGILTAAARQAITAIAVVDGAWCPTLSPDGDRVAYVTDRSGLPRVEVAGTEVGPAGTAMSTTVSGAQEEAISVAWSPDGEWLAYLVSPEGSIRAELHAVRPDGSDHRVVAGAGPLETVFAGGWTAEPGWYACSIADGTSPDADVCRVHVQTGERQTLLAGGFLVVTAVSRDGRRLVARRGPRGRRHLVLGTIAPSAPARPAVVRLLQADFPRSGSADPDDPAAEVGDTAEDGRFSPDGRTVYLRTAAGRERSVLAEVPLDEDGRPGRLRVLAERDDADVEGYAVRPGGDFVVMWNVSGRSELEVRSAGLGTRQRGRPVPLPQSVVPGWSLHGDGNQMVVEATGPRSPRSLYRVRLDGPGDASLKQRGNQSGSQRGNQSGNQPGDQHGSHPPNQPGIQPGGHQGRQRLRQRRAALPVVRRLAAMPDLVLPDTLVTPTPQRYRSIDGLPLEGWLYRGPDQEIGSAPGATVVLFHGGPEAQERPTFALLAQSLVAAGITVFAPNVRGSTGYGSSFTAADDGARREGAFQDVPATVQHLVDAGVAQPGKVGVLGWSYGGYLALVALTRWPHLFAAGVSHAGMSDLRTFFAGTEPWMAGASTLEYGDPATQPDLLRGLSPLAHLHRVDVPTLLVHGDRDTNVPVSESVQAHQALLGAHVPTELLLLEGEGHTIVGAPRRVVLALSVAGWFARWLRP